MLDHLKNINLNEEINRDSFYPLLKTNSCGINLFVLSEIQKFSKTSDFFKHYTNKQTSIYTNLLNNIETELSNIYEDKNISKKTSKFEKYMTLMSKIILATHLICKIKEILVEFAQKTKNYYNKNIHKDLQSNLDSFINDCDNKIFNQTNNIKNEDQKEYYTRCSTKTNTVSCKSQFLSKDTLQKFEISKNCENISPENNSISKKNTIEDEEIFLDVNTPKFKDNINTVNTVNTNEYEDGAFLFMNKRSKTLQIENTQFDKEENENPQNSENCRVASSLSLANLKFTNSDSSKSKQKLRTSNKKNNTVSGPIRKMNQDQNIRNQIIRDLLETVGVLYRKNKINSEQRVELKKKIIASSDKLINLFYELYARKNFDKANLIETLKNLINL